MAEFVDMVFLRGEARRLAQLHGQSEEWHLQQMVRQGRATHIQNLQIMAQQSNRRALDNIQGIDNANRERARQAEENAFEFQSTRQRRPVLNRNPQIALLGGRMPQGYVPIGQQPLQFQPRPLPIGQEEMEASSYRAVSDRERVRRLQEKRSQPEGPAVPPSQPNFGRGNQGRARPSRTTTGASIPGTMSPPLEQRLGPHIRSIEMTNAINRTNQPMGDLGDEVWYEQIPFQHAPYQVSQVTQEDRADFINYHRRINDFFASGGNPEALNEEEQMQLLEQVAQGNATGSVLVPEPNNDIAMGELTQEAPHQESMNESMVQPQVAQSHTVSQIFGKKIIDVRRERGLVGSKAGEHLENIGKAATRDTGGRVTKLTKQDLIDIGSENLQKPKGKGLARIKKSSEPIPYSEKKQQRRKNIKENVKKDKLPIALPTQPVTRRIQLTPAPTTPSESPVQSTSPILQQPRFTTPQPLNKYVEPGLTSGQQTFKNTINKLENQVNRQSMHEAIGLSHRIGESQIQGLPHFEMPAAPPGASTAVPQNLPTVTPMEHITTPNVNQDKGHVIQQPQIQATTPATIEEAQRQERENVLLAELQGGSVQQPVPVSAHPSETPQVHQLPPETPSEMVTPPATPVQRSLSIPPPDITQRPASARGRVAITPDQRIQYSTTDPNPLVIVPEHSKLGLSFQSANPLGASFEEYRLMQLPVQGVQSVPEGNKVNVTHVPQSQPDQQPVHQLADNINNPQASGAIDTSLALGLPSPYITPDIQQQAANEAKQYTWHTDKNGPYVINNTNNQTYRPQQLQQNINNIHQTLRQHASAGTTPNNAMVKIHARQAARDQLLMNNMHNATVNEHTPIGTMLPSQNSHAVPVLPASSTGFVEKIQYNDQNQHIGSQTNTSLTPTPRDQQRLDHMIQANEGADVAAVTLSGTFNINGHPVKSVHQSPIPGTNKRVRINPYAVTSTATKRKNEELYPTRSKKRPRDSNRIQSSSPSLQSTPAQTIEEMEQGISQPTAQQVFPPQQMEQEVFRFSGAGGGGGGGDDDSDYSGRKGKRGRKAGKGQDSNKKSKSGEFKIPGVKHHSRNAMGDFFTGIDPNNPQDMRTGYNNMITQRQHINELEKMKIQTDWQKNVGVPVWKAETNANLKVYLNQRDYEQKLALKEKEQEHQLKLRDISAQLTRDQMAATQQKVETLEKGANYRKWLAIGGVGIGAAGSLAGVLFAANKDKKQDHRTTYNKMIDKYINNYM